MFSSRLSSRLLGLLCCRRRFCFGILEPHAILQVLQLALQRHLGVRQESSAGFEVPYPVFSRRLDDVLLLLDSK